MVNPMILWVLLGLVLRITLPYLTERINDNDEPLSFDIRYLVGQVLANVVAYIPALFDPSYLEYLNGLTAVLAVAVGWGVSDMGREIQKVYSAVGERLR